jgi:hypothetical protein
MAMTIDHLSVEHVVHVIQAFTDARGIAHDVGEEGLITSLTFDHATNEIGIAWTRGATTETMHFLATHRDGPGIGRMKSYFDVGEYVPAPVEGKRFVAGVGYVPLAPTLPPLTPALITTDARFDDAMDRVWALAGAARFDEAATQLDAIVYATDRRGDNTERAAGALCACARLHAFDDDLATHRWLREHGIQLWYSWGSQATSGGEGTERARHIRAAERDLLELDRALGRDTA